MWLNHDYSVILVRLLCLFGLCAVFVTERETEMYMLLRTAKQGSGATVAAKLTAIIQVFDLTYCAIRFSLPHGDYSLQSIQSFGGTAKELTLWQAFWLQFALKELGFLYAAILILLLSVCLKKFALALMAGIAILPIPLLTVAEQNAFLRIPGPWALTLGGIYLNGSISSTDAVTGETIYILKELNMEEMEVFAGAVGVIILLMLYLIRHQNVNWHMKSFRKKAAIVLCAVMLTLSGCGGSAPENTFYNMSTSSWCETEDHMVTMARSGESRTIWSGIPTTRKRKSSRPRKPMRFCAPVNFMTAVSLYINLPSMPRYSLARWSMRSTPRASTSRCTISMLRPKMAAITTGS